MTGFVHGKDSLLGCFLRVAKRKGKCIARRTSRCIFLCALRPSRNTDKWTKIPIRENFLIKISFFCYGCDAAIRAPAHDVILQLYCNRVYKNKNRESCVAAKRSACYFHLNLECARKAVPRMELRDIVLHDETRPACSQEQINKLLRFGVV